MPPPSAPFPPDTPVPELVQLLLRNAPASIILLRPVYAGEEITDFAYVQVNPTAQLRFGLPEHPTATMLSLFPWLAGQGMAFCRRVFESGETGHYEAGFAHPDQRRHYHIRAERLGPLLVVTLTQLPPPELPEPATLAHTQALQAARAAAETQWHTLRDIFEQAPVAIAILRGPELVVELANTAVAAIWGRPAAEVLGRPYFEAVPDTAGQGFEEILAHVLHTGEPFFITEAPVHLARAHTGQPTLGYVNFGFHPLRDGQGRPVALLALGTEVTEQVLARQKVQQLNDQLEAANATLAATNQRLTRTNIDLDTFVYTASHDLKAPITNIEGLLEAFRESLPAECETDEQVQTLLHLMHGSVQRFQHTIGHLTDIARLQQTYDEPPQAVNLLSTVDDVRLDLAPRLAEAQAELQTDFDPQLTVALPPQHLRSIVYNLLSNALKYRQPGRPPRIQLRATRSAQATTLAVHDNGLGLDPSQQERIFGLFQRLHTHVEGSGVGLYVVKRLVENVGGSVTVESELGVGTTFTITLPE